MITSLKHYWKPLTLIALMAFSLWGAYSAGYHNADTSWRLKWVLRDKNDSDALTQRQVEARTEEQRRQRVINKVIQNASQQYMPLIMMQFLPMLLLAGCTNRPTSSPSDWQTVKGPAVPQLPTEARQQAEPNCLPSCSSVLMKRREEWQQLLMRQESED